MPNEDNTEPKTVRHDGCFDRFNQFPPTGLVEYVSKADLPDELRAANLKNAVIATKTKTDQNPFGYLIKRTFIEVEAGCKSSNDSIVGANAVAKIRID